MKERLQRTIEVLSMVVALLTAIVGVFQVVEEILPSHEEKDGE